MDRTTRQGFCLAVISCLGIMSLWILTSGSSRGHGVSPQSTVVTPATGLSGPGSLTARSLTTAGDESVPLLQGKLATCSKALDRCSRLKASTALGGRNMAQLGYGSTGGSASKYTQELEQCRDEQSTLQTVARLCQSDLDSITTQLREAQARIRALEEALEQATAGRAVHSPPTPPPPSQTPAPYPSGGGVVQSTGASSRRPWLVIGLPSISRGSYDYLNPTLDFILEQLPSSPDHPMFGKVKIVVGTPEGLGHAAFEKAESRFVPGAHPQSSMVEFYRFTRDASAPGYGQGSTNVPGPAVRQQSRDVVQLIRYAAEQGEHYMLMEDDFRLCPHGLMAIMYLMDKANKQSPDWIVLRIGYGLSGAVLHSKDALAFADYLHEHQGRRPPDHLFVEWFAGEKPQSRSYTQGRPHIAFRHNLFEHLGRRSTLRGGAAPQHAGCYEELLEPVLFQVEAFKLGQCGHTDVWPCRSEEANARNPPINWTPLIAQIERWPPISPSD